MNKFVIGIRRDESIVPTPGPGTYSPERADNLILARAVAFDFSR